ncbi:cytochrome P450 2B4-like [Argopecten irradians]|uniref:cytochrome P450 2B4-like n=1 Tax=Argopecten irradians TaxID=31199 RepID=UPI00372496E3
MEFLSALSSDGLTVSLCFGVVCLLIYLSFLHNRVNIPGPFAIPVFGNIFQILFYGRCYRYEKLHKLYGNVSRLYLGRRLFVMICGKDLIYDAFVRQADSFSDRPDGMTEILDQKKEHGIIWSNGETWKVLRRFTLQSMRDFGLGKECLEDRILEECNVVLGEMSRTDSKLFRIVNLYKDAVSNITHTIIFGKRCDYQDSAFREVIYNIDMFFSLSLGGISPTTIWPFLKLFLKSDLATRTTCLKNISRYIKAQVEEHKSSFDAAHIRDFVDLYLQAEKNGQSADIITHGQMFRVILNLFGAGTDTTATSLNWAALYMISFPEVQTRCQRDIDKVVGQGRQMRLSDKPDLPYVEATLLEVQRLANVAIASLPHVASRDAVVGGFRIPKGAIVMAGLQATHEDQNCWNDPLVFRPDRFIGSDGKIKKLEGFMPFSVGPRACLGDSLAKKVMFLIFCNTLQSFNLRKKDEGDILSLEGELGITRMPKPYELRAIPRK